MVVVSTKAVVVSTKVIAISTKVVVISTMSLSRVMVDPRFSTVHAYDFNGAPFYEFKKGSPFYLPATVNEVWCKPGYQPKRPNKGIQLTVNDYPFHHIQYGGPKWAEVVNTPFQTDN